MGLLLQRSRNAQETPKPCRFISRPKYGGVKGVRFMATIRASCSDCGDVELTTADVSVRICDDNNHGTYSFRCPTCEMTIVKSAEPRTIDLLVASGVAFTTWQMPAELSEIKEGEPIYHDDLLDFHDLLSDDRALEQALAEFTG